MIENKDLYGPFAEIIASVRAEKARCNTMDWSIPEMPEMQQDKDTHKLQPSRERCVIPEATKTIHDVREELPNIILDYLTSDDERILLLRSQAGTGKTHAAVSVVQQLAQSGMRGLILSPNHNAFSTSRMMPHFDPSLWHHVKGMSQPYDDTTMMCRHNIEQNAWSSRGLQSFKLCLCLCRKNGWAEFCPYNQQFKNKSPLYFAVHDYLVYGMRAKKFDFAICDENPIGRFVKTRKVPIEGLHCGESGLLYDIVDKLIKAGATTKKGERTNGRNFLGDKLDDASLGNLLLRALDDDYLAQLELGLGGAPAIPTIREPHEVHSLPYFYLWEFLNLVTPELNAWKSDWELWNERVWMTQSNLVMIDKAEVWEGMPRKLVMMDATGEPELYKLVFDRDVIVYEPHVKRYGKTIQITGRLNGKKLTTEMVEVECAKNRKTALSKLGQELLEAVCEIDNRRRVIGLGKSAAICWKQVVDFFKGQFGENVLWFGTETGSNDFEDMNSLFVCGTPDPGDTNMTDMATALTGEIRPFWHTEDGVRKRKVNKTHDHIPLTESGVQFVREHWRDLFSQDALDRAGITHPDQISGVKRLIRHYSSNILDLLHRQFRQGKLIQAMERIRLTNPDADDREARCYLFSPVPSVPVDEIYNDPPVSPFGIKWYVWKKLELKLVEWYVQGQQSITYDLMAEQTGVSRGYLSNNKIMAKIIQSEFIILSGSIGKPMRLCDMFGIDDGATITSTKRGRRHQYIMRARSEV